MKIDYRKFQLVISVVALITIVLLFTYIIEYKNVLVQNPCEYIESVSTYKCVPDPELYVCACGKYYSMEQVAEFNKTKLDQTLVKEET